jgi:hypothetical protein
MEIEGKVGEIDALRTEEEAAAEAPEDPSKDAFPMVDDAPTQPGKTTGWEAADRFFKSDG